MIELIQTLYEIVFDSANVVPALNILTWAGFYGIALTGTLVVLREHLLPNLYYRLRGSGGLWRIRLTAETNLSLDDFLAWLTPAAAFSTIGSDTDYDRACATTPASIVRTAASMPARLLRPTPFKLLVISATLFHFVPTWPSNVYRQILPYLLVLPEYLRGIDLVELLTRIEGGMALIGALLFGGAFAAYKAALRRDAAKLEGALEYGDRIAKVLEDVLSVTRKNINTLHSRMKDLPSYFPPSDEDRPLRWFHPAFARSDDFSVHFESFEGKVNKVVESLTRIEEDNLMREYFNINRRVSYELLSLGLYSAEAAGRLPRKLLDASWVGELFEAWISQLSSLPKGERDEEIRRRATDLLTDAIKSEVQLSRFLRKTGRSGFLKRMLFGFGTIGS